MSRKEGEERRVEGKEKTTFFSCLTTEAISVFSHEIVFEFDNNQAL